PVSSRSRRWIYTGVLHFVHWMRCADLTPVAVRSASSRLPAGSSPIKPIGVAVQRRKLRIDSTFPQVPPAKVNASGPPDSERTTSRARRPAPAIRGARSGMIRNSSIQVQALSVCITGEPNVNDWPALKCHGGRIRRQSVADALQVGYRKIPL